MGPNQDCKGIVAVCRFACWPAEIPQFWRCAVECYRHARSIDASTLASSFKYAIATVVMPHNNMLHRFSLSWGLCADKWVLNCRKNHHVHLPRQFLLAHLFLCGEPGNQCERSCFDFESRQCTRLLSHVISPGQGKWKCL